MTQEERTRIYEEEKARVEARSRIETDARRTRGRRTGKVVSNLILFCVVAGLVAWAVSYYRSYDSVTVESLDAKVAAQREVDYQKTRADLQAAGVNPDNINGPRLDASHAKLFGISQHFVVEDGYCKVDGEVKNVSTGKLENVEAIVTFYDENKDVVKTADALIDYNPILPGQTSPFNVSTTGNPAIRTETLTFAFLNGTQIPTSHH